MRFPYTICTTNKLVARKLKKKYICSPFPNRLPCSTSFGNIYSWNFWQKLNTKLKLKRLLPQPQNSTQDTVCSIIQHSERDYHPRVVLRSTAESHICYIYSFIVLEVDICWSHLYIVTLLAIIVFMCRRVAYHCKSFPSLLHSTPHMLRQIFVKFMKYKFYYVSPVNHFDKIFSAPFMGATYRGWHIRFMCFVYG